ncbi:hypothetical protein BGZ70_009618 [Mortierella alpina]|uniref:Stress-associated endoplasmic reticulum protein n=1 Tax=Mortierella alpina TaxID=64518 RepID=A0A9P6J336_MORAP|nr:hypothetical protein BGZ70_009618 [Mortierella alpina]
MTTAASPVIRARNAKYQTNVTKRGLTKASHADKGFKKSSISPYLVGFLIVVLCGGAIFEILRLFGASVEPDY